MGGHQMAARARFYVSKFFCAACQPNRQAPRFVSTGLAVTRSDKQPHTIPLEFSHEKADRRSGRLDVRYWCFRC